MIRKHPSPVTDMLVIALMLVFEFSLVAFPIYFLF